MCFLGKCSVLCFAKHEPNDAGAGEAREGRTDAKSGEKKKSRKNVKSSPMKTAKVTVSPESEDEKQPLKDAMTAKKNT